MTHIILSKVKFIHQSSNYIQCPTFILTILTCIARHNHFIYYFPSHKIVCSFFVPTVELLSMNIDLNILINKSHFLSVIGDVKLTPACANPCGIIREMLNCRVFFCTIYHLICIQQFIDCWHFIRDFIPLNFKSLRIQKLSNV